MSSAGYTVHAGAVHESSGGMTSQQLNYRGNPNWYEFGACHVATDGEGYCEVKKDGMRHVAVRTCGRESTYKPAVRLALPGLVSPVSSSVRLAGQEYRAAAQGLEEVGDRTRSALRRQHSDP